MYETIRLFTALVQPICVTETYEKVRGREEHRRIELFDNQANIPKGWKNIERIARVTLWGIRGGKDFNKLSFYMLSEPTNSSKKVAQMIRQHWFIENKLHWVKDVILHEDNMTIEQPQMATIVSCFNTVVLNILRLAGYKPTKNTFAIFTNKVKELISLFQKKT